MKVLAYDIAPQAENLSPDFAYVALDELLARADVITLHSPLTPETEGIINQENIAKMKKSVLIINTARGRLIVEMV
jgi:phosphoglycerate dehydrogenase-like enzyme